MTEGRRLVVPLCWLALLLAATLGMGQLEGLFRVIEPDSRQDQYCGYSSRCAARLNVSARRDCR